MIDDGDDVDDDDDGDDDDDNDDDWWWSSSQQEESGFACCGVGILLSILTYTQQYSAILCNTDFYCCNVVQYCDDSSRS